MPTFAIITFLSLISLAAGSGLTSYHVPGSSCGIMNPIRVLDRDPTDAERAAGCILVRKRVPTYIKRKK